MTPSERILAEITRKNIKKFDDVGTNINNINNNNNITTQQHNNITTSIIESDDSNEVENLSSISSVGRASPKDIVASPKDSIHFSGGSELPAGWRGLKLDLYGRTPTGRRGYKLKASVIKSDGTTVGFVASLNSPHNRVFKRDNADDFAATWQLIHDQYLAYKNSFGLDMNTWRCSKFYMFRKQRSVNDLAVFVQLTPKDYQVRLIFRAKIYDYTLSKSTFAELSQRQIELGQVATAYFGRSLVKMIDPKELGL